MSPVEVLIAARALISPAGNWCQRANAVDAAGQPTSTTSKGAVRFCASGAITHTYAPSDAGWRAYELLRKAIGGGQVYRWNDAAERTHAEVLAAFDRAIASAREAAP